MSNIGIEFLRRKNIGNYEHIELKVADYIPEGVDKINAVKGLMKFVKDALDGTGDFGANGKSEVVTANAGTLEATKSKTKVAEVKTEVKAEIKAEPKLDAKVEEKKVEVKEEKKAEVKEEKKTEATAAKKETTVKAKATKITAYDRNLDPHKNNLGVFLDASFPGWRKPENLKKAGTASRELQGAEFLDAEGNIVQSFKDAFSKHMVDLV